MAKKDARKLHPAAQEAIRLRIASFLHSGKGTQSEAAQIFQVSLSCIKKIYKRYKEGGMKVLQAKKRGPVKSTARLSKAQVKHLQRHQKGHTGQTSSSLSSLDGRGGTPVDQKKVRVSYGVRHVRHLLKSWGFTPQKPAFRAYEQSRAQVRNWLKQDYFALKGRAQKQRGIMFWLDEVGMRSQYQAGTTYGPKGRTPVLPGTGQRFGVNMISAISNRGQLVFMMMEGRFNGGVLICFLQKLLRSVKQKVFLIADSHPVHLQKKVTNWLQERKAAVELILLPTYSPELNPDEYFNQHLKTNGVGKPRPKTNRNSTPWQRSLQRRKNENLKT